MRDDEIADHYLCTVIGNDEPRLFACLRSRHTHLIGTMPVIKARKYALDRGFYQETYEAFIADDIRQWTWRKPQEAPR